MLLRPPAEQCIPLQLLAPPFEWWNLSCLVICSGTGEDTKQSTEQITLAAQTSF